MDRRSFFKSLALIGAAVSVSPHIFIPKFEPVRWKVHRLEPNPEYVSCQFQVMFVDHPGHYDMRIVDNLNEADRILIGKEFDQKALLEWKVGHQVISKDLNGWDIKKMVRRIA